MSLWLAFFLAFLHQAAVTSRLKGDLVSGNSALLNNDESQNSTVSHLRVGTRLVPEPKVVNGIEVFPAFKYPYIVRILVVLIDYPGHWCGGTLIHKEWVLTAAHCSFENPAIYRVEVHRHDLTKDVNDERTQVRQVREIHSHPSYGSYNGNNNDISVWKLDSPIDISDDVETAVLDGGFYDRLDNDVSIIGWGSLEDTTQQPLPDRLQQAELNIIDCADTNYRMLRNYAFSESELCAGGRAGVRVFDACFGDSGGPLIDTDTSIQVGLVSWGISCGIEGFPTVYARLSERRNREFIDSLVSGVQWAPSSSARSPPPPTTPVQISPASPAPPESVDMFPECEAEVSSWIGDGYCDSDDYNTESCHYDGGDCCVETCESNDYACGENGYDCIDPAVPGSGSGINNEESDSRQSRGTQDACSVEMFGSDRPINGYYEILEEYDNPIYRNDEEELFLYIGPTAEWMIGPSMSSTDPIARVDSAASLPQNIRSSWEILVGDSWIADANVEIECSGEDTGASNSGAESLLCEFDDGRVSGTELGELILGSVQDCCMECKQDSHICTVWMFKSSEGLCTLFSEITGCKESESFVYGVSQSSYPLPDDCIEKSETAPPSPGPRDTSPPSQNSDCEYESGEWRGDQLYDTETDTEEDCCGACQRRPTSCKHWQWRREQCIMFGTATPVTSSASWVRSVD